MNSSLETPESADERKLRELLREGGEEPGRAHDERILAAARSMAANRRAGQRARRRFRWNAPLGLAAAIAIAAVGLYAILGTQQPADTLRGGEGAAGEVYPAPNASLDAPPAEFRWRAVPGATQYRVVVMDAEARVLWESAPVRESHAGFDVRLPGSGPWLWSVEASGPRLEQKLGPYSFRLE